jgi:hypothetical protein
MLSLPEKPEFDHASSTVFYELDRLLQGGRHPARERRCASEVSRSRQALSSLLRCRITTWMAFLRDPDHNPLALMSEVRKG